MSDAATIFALSSGRGRAGIAVIRISGADAGNALRWLTRRALPLPRRATLVSIVHPASGEALDRGLALWLPAPHSVTGEDLAELHVHGGAAVIAGVLDALADLSGLRPAEPGEFTKRAFLNEKIDLTGAEGLDDLIAAETAAQRRQALCQMEGGLAELYDGWRERLIKGLAWFEAAIDFPDEALPASVESNVLSELQIIELEIRNHLNDRGRGERLRDGLSVAILGAPNVGKSSLLNALTRDETAIVSPLAGTTRDIVEARLDLGGLPILLADTAGLRQGSESNLDPIEREGMRRALLRAERADLKLVMIVAGTEPDDATRRLAASDAILVANKADLVERQTSPSGAMLVSAKTGAGLDSLRARLLGEAEERLAAGEGPVITRARHRSALTECADALRRASGAAAPELAAEDVRLANRALGRITGRVDVEHLLDIIFRDFCIGK